MSAAEPSAALPPRIEVASSAARIALVDVGRGLAIVAMVIYHFTWDLSLQGLIGLDPTSNPGWIWFARLIAGSFLALVGVSLVLASRRGFRWEPHLRRVAMIAAAALLITAVTWFAYNAGYLPAFVYFGILHAIALFSLAAVPFLGAPLILVAMAAAASFAAPVFLTGSFFDAWPLVWLGLSASPPAAVDYVPFFPWFGCTLIGVLGARLALRWQADAFWARWQPKDFVGRALVTAGRWSLIIYLVHQPILFALTSVAAAVIPSPIDSGRDFEARVQVELNACVSDCARNGRYSETVCTAYCACVFGEWRANGLLERMFQGAVDFRDQLAMTDVVERCQPVQPVPPPFPPPAADPSVVAPEPPVPPALQPPEPAPGPAGP